MSDTSMLQTRSTWLFQANPNRYHIQESLRAEREEFWNLNQHADDVSPGDRVLIWVCGEDAGIYAIGTVMSAPEVRPDSAAGMGYWVQHTDGRRPKARVCVRYDHVFLDHPLLKSFIAIDPVLAHLAVVRSPRGTNYAVSDEEWQTITMWLDEASIGWS